MPDSRKFPATDAWGAIFLWISKPSAYNKHVATSETFYVNAQQSPEPLDILKAFFQDTSLKDTTCGSLKSNLSTHLSKKGVDFQETFNDAQGLSGCWVVVRLCIPKTGAFNARHVDVLNCDFDVGIVEFLYLDHQLQRHYTISYDGTYVEFESDHDSAEIGRIKELFTSKIEKWTQNPNYYSGTQSLCLIDQEGYYKIYNRLKKKYCQSIRDIWEESTDPDKFIHEDVAIATYLILVWGEKPQTFVDLGCGNGLLVHILCSEGHRGHGIDVRSRKIWKSYPQGTILKEQTIVPSPSYTFPGVDWIIGNHSDELTPWIPVIALLSSPSTNFFLLPCCAYEFSGVKYRRINTSKSQYMDYLDYVEKVCTDCGFLVNRDRLKIPSTKRICFVSRGRIELPISEVDRVLHIVNCSGANGQTDKFLSEIKTRDSVEKVRNCTQLDKNFVNSLVLKIFNMLLGETIPENSTWFAGIPMDISSIAGNLTREDLLKLKSECGGLQTFLRNHRFIFTIAEGKVFLRKPESASQRTKFWKTKPCWFYTNHPQSCPLSDKDCSYSHLEAKLI